MTSHKPVPPKPITSPDPLSSPGSLSSSHPPAPQWPRAPVHHLSQSGTYFVTSGTYLKQHFFQSTDRLDVLQRGLLSVAEEFGWQLEAWAIFSNHYHFIGHSPGNEGGESLSTMLSKLHSKTATWVNRIDCASGRKVWHNFRETLLTIHASYLARLNYVHHNAVKHGLVDVANQYRWCSASWFEINASAAQVRSLYATKFDSVNVYDEYAPRRIEDAK